MRSRPAATPTSRFDPGSFTAFRFLGREVELTEDGDGLRALVRLRYALDRLELEERIVVQSNGPTRSDAEARLAGPPVSGLLDLLHWVAGVSYYKAAAPPTLSFEGGAAPGRAAQALLEAVYSEGLGEFAVVNDLPALPRPRFRYGPDGAAGRAEDGPAAADAAPSGPTRRRAPSRLLVPVGGGKDSAVAIEIARASGLETTLFSIGDAAPIRATAQVAGYPRLIARRTIDPRLLELNARGALNGHVPITAIVSCVALLTAALNGQDTVLLANERSASAGNLVWHGVEVNHQFSKSVRAERLLAAALGEIPDAPSCCSLLRPASELAIARAFARYRQYHRAFTSCNRVFRLDPARRTSSWCCDCDKCRFVFLILAPFTTPAQLTEIFGRDLLADAGQYDGFARLTATGGAKPFECVGEVDECLAAIRLLAANPDWRDHPVLARLTTEILAQHPVSARDLERHFALSDDHEVADQLIGAVRAVLSPAASSPAASSPAARSPAVPSA